MKSFFKISLLCAFLLVSMKLSCSNGQQVPTELQRANNLSASVLVGIARGSIVALMTSLSHHMAIGSSVPPILAAIVGGAATGIVVNKAGTETVEQLIGKENTGASFLTSLATAVIEIELYYSLKGSRDIEEAAKKRPNRQ